MKQILLIIALVGCGKKEPAQPSGPDLTTPFPPVSEASNPTTPPPFIETKAKAEAGDATGQFSLGAMYYNGQGVGQDFKEALKWYQKAADQGDLKAQSSLGMMHEKIQAAEQDLKKAAAQGAAQGDANAQTKLGAMYYSGQGVEQDFKEALKWYQKAADQGDATAQLNLGVMYGLGEGVEQDYVVAYAWASIAAANGDKNVPYLIRRRLAVLKSEFLEPKMTREQITEAEELVKEMVKKNPKLLNTK